MTDTASSTVKPVVNRAASGAPAAADPSVSHSLMARYRRLMGPVAWRQVLGGIGIGVLSGVFSGLALLFLLPASVALATGRVSWGLGFGAWLIVLAVLAVASAVGDYFSQRIGMTGALGFQHDVHYAIGDQVARVPLSWFTADSAGVMSRAVSREMMSLSESVAHFLNSLSTTVAGCVVIWLGSWAWDWRLGLLLTCAAPLLAVFLRVSRRLIDRGKAVSEPAERELAARIVEFARCQGALRSCHAGADYRQLADAFDVAARTSRRGLWWETAGNLVNGVLVQIIIVAMIALSAALSVSGALEPLQAVVTIGICLRFTTMLDTIGTTTAGIEERRQMMNHLDAVMDVPPLPEPDAAAVESEPGAVELDDVHFAYRADTPVLRGVSMRVPAHSMCAIVGPSGSGKTTIARLIARFWDVDAGTVRVGGTDVRDMPVAELMSRLSMVFQDVYLFDDTLEANIRIGNLGADAARVRWAADLAGVTEIVDRLPDGWDTRVGEGGQALSGGERQRVSIARALLKQAPIVLLDEATSALDAENEAHIVSAMQELRRNSTLIVIAHKLETIAAADQVVVLGADGRVAQHGTHADLVDAPGPYQDFWNYRSRAAGWQLV
ncbi:ABC transporter ATP-binding protein [Actinomyces ruminicola]|uniref:ATP-binding cassette, subfamily B n=1 Tax=Actinomyces ruminicola TaxID=332524 RepID=A0A1G9T4H3_9ACTO|nr:ABC transporter ATP-binding protein [Actinomyces ruminicola]SDM42542.1 ATP-binding cassette, subfamily B [Actinomyces ruminicola]